MGFLALADENGNVELEKSASLFVEQAVEAIRKKLRHEDASFDLMPYRHCGFEFLGFDWSDSVGNEMSFTFCFSDPNYLPEMVTNGIQYDVVLRDFTDALQMIRAIAIGVKGDSIGRV